MSFDTDLTSPSLDEDSPEDLDIEQDDLEPEDDLDTPEGEPDLSDEPRTETTRRTTNQRRAASDKNLIRRSAQKALELTNADPSDRALLATVLGSDDDPVQLTVAVISADRGALAGLQEVIDLADTDPIERGVTLMSLGRPRMRAIWQMYGDLGVENITGPIPNVDAKAAMALVTATIGPDVRERMDRVLKLAKRG